MTPSPATPRKKTMSLRTRLTLTTIAILILTAALLTVTSLFNASNILFSPPTTEVHAGESASDLNEASSGDGAVQETYVGPSSGQDQQSGGASDSQGPSATNDEARSEQAATFSQFSIIAMAAIVAIGGVITYFAVGRAIRPVRTLSEQISEISENALDTRLPDEGNADEVGTLVDAFNRLLSRLEKAFEDQRGFAAAAAHELKTPLAAIKANVDVLEMDVAPALSEYQNLAQVAKTQTNRMIRLVDDLFTISMGEAYDFADSVVLESVIDDIVRELQPAIAEKQLIVSVHSQVTRPLLGNAAMLRHALANIIENAVKYNTQEGRIDITLLETEKGFIATIADTGVGIPEEHRAHVFDAFYRVDKSRSRKMGGAGLGLSIAQNMVARHGGSISIWENAPQGTVFTVELPKSIL